MGLSRASTFKKSFSKKETNLVVALMTNMQQPEGATMVASDVTKIAQTVASSCQRLHNESSLGDLLGLEGVA